MSERYYLPVESTTIWRDGSIARERHGNVVYRLEGLPAGHPSTLMGGGQAPAPIYKPRGGHVVTLGEPSPGLPYAKGSETSFEAAETHLTKSQKQEAMVEAYLRACDTRGSTDDEGEVKLGLGSSSYTPRRLKLVEKGRIVASRETRPTRSGKRAVVYVATGLLQDELAI